MEIRNYKVYWIGWTKSIELRLLTTFLAYQLVERASLTP